MRQDLPRGALAAQLVHAAGESAPPEGIPSGTYAVVLAAQDEAQLVAIERDLVRLGVPHHAVREPDEPRNGALMAIGFAPTRDRRQISRVLGRLPLLK